MTKTPPTPEQVSSILQLCCVARASIHDHSPGSMDNFQSCFDKWIYRVATPSGKYKSIITCDLIDFPTEAGRLRYQKAFETYLTIKEKLGREAPEDAAIQELVALGQFLKAAEVERAEVLSKRAIHSVTTDGQAVGVGFNYKATAVKAIKHLMVHCGVRREEISVVWGGDDAFETKNRLSPPEMFMWLGKMARQEHVPGKIKRIVERQMAESDEDSKEADELSGYDFQFGTQTRARRQDEINRFQTGKSLYCFFSRAAGGVGLSLHHAAADNRGRPITLRQRRGYMCPCWSAQDIVQLLGRLHRTIFSLSDTRQDILWFRGTMEEHVMRRVSVKLKSLSKIVKQREDWTDAIIGSTKSDTRKQWEDDMRKEAINPATGFDGNDIVAGDSDEEEEE